MYCISRPRSLFGRPRKSCVGSQPIAARICLTQTDGGLDSLHRYKHWKTVWPAFQPPVPIITSIVRTASSNHVILQGIC